MPEPRHSQGNPGTYIIQERYRQEEMNRLAVQDRMLIIAMGGVLPEQTNPTDFHQVLDVGCGSGTWAIEAAQVYPDMTITGIDINQKIAEYASKQAVTARVADRVNFQVMDTLSSLDFPDHTFDMANLCLGVGFMRTWDWSKVLQEMLRVTRKGGILRWTEASLCPVRCSSVASLRLYRMFVDALQHSGHLVSPGDTGLTEHIAPALKRFGCSDVQSVRYERISRGKTEQARLYREDTEYLFRIIRPFIQKWGGYSAEEIETLYQQATREMALPDFEAQGLIVTAWGRN